MYGEVSASSLCMEPKGTLFYDSADKYQIKVCYALMAQAWKNAPRLPEGRK